ncbi:hypothetical protein [Novosphingobium cyanobacteriorum]|uniref:PAS domain-containing protein n=1 Tax=Novosphingobium cyanobacteriorum TaxID=3024215 RepID=A0ABT6CH32_9SPHN|nr:hypothetical protein [Novosphingobium cyanobacteriorum]MDF8333236.1 hypothetical protein [Novosphingobium cyanobacteriorum]
MDGLYGSGFDSRDDHADDMVVEAPPPVVGQDERRMQVRAYNFWASLLGQGQYPRPDTLLAGKVPDFAANAVLLHFDEGLEDPSIMLVGQALADECGAEHALHRLSDVPGRSLLSRITDHYLQIIANKAPIGFEAEFVNQRGRTILYRGILLPFSTDNETIDYIYGVINWKELAEQHTTDELLLELGQSLEEPSPKRGEPFGAPLAEWADGPATLDLADYGEILPFPNAFDDDLADIPSPSFGADATAEMTLADWLASARDYAAAANSSEDRTRSALYAAIGRAWDFALAAQAEPDEYAEMVAEAGLTMQERAPLTPLVKLVFGADYDKTRLTEFVTALNHAQRLGLGRGELGRFLADAPGGLKGVVSTERRLRREEAGRDGRSSTEVLAESLRALPPRRIETLPAQGAEFALVVVRRLPDGTVALLGEIEDDLPLFERAARKLVG